MEKQGAKNAQYNNEHYKKCIIEPLEFMERELSKEEYLGFIKGNIIKYRLRAGHKQGASIESDIEKALYYEELYNKKMTEDYEEEANV